MRFARPLTGLAVAVLLAACGGSAEPTAQVYDTLAVSQISSENCQATAPANWAIVEGAYAAGVDLYTSDQSMAASWGIFAVPANYPIVTPTEGPWDDPDVYSDTPMTALMGFLRHYLTPYDDTALQIVQQPKLIGDYAQFTMNSDTDGYVVFFTTFQGDGYNAKYYLVVRIGRTTLDLWTQRAGFVGQIAASIRCNVQVGEMSSPDLSAGSTPVDSGDDSEAGYNPWLGAEYVTDPSTGQNFLVTNQEWSSDGPDGPGYYYQSGNDWVKLQPGRTD